MIVERPSWINHGGSQIFSIDIQPGGRRFATGGGDNKVCIWNMKSVGRKVRTNDSTSKLLATLHGHIGSVNCVRWAKHGRCIASGSDDQMILIHIRKTGRGEPPEVENWKVVMTLRGHAADVVDLNWSPDNSKLASGSLDNTIHIWDLSSGSCTAVLRGHSSLVKGVTWDPIGLFVASQSDDKSVIIWQTSDWSLAHRTVGHWNKTRGSTFFRRLAWSPCGHFITTTHGFKKPKYSAPVLERGEWVVDFDFSGHKAPINVVKFNHSMFCRNPSGSRNLRASYIGGTYSFSNNEEKDQHPYNVIAIGSQDQTITLWTTASPRPLLVASHFFSHSVVDLSWSTDGFSLFACSLDGTIATFHFGEHEIGYKLTDAELDELKRNRYDEVRSQQGNLDATPGQILLETAPTKKASTKRNSLIVQENEASAKTSGKLVVSSRISEAHTNNVVKGNNLIGNMPNKAISSYTSSLVKQIESRLPDGRRRITPESVEATELLEGTFMRAQSKAFEFAMNSSTCSKDDIGVISTDVDIRASSIRRAITVTTDSKNSAGVTARAITIEDLVVEKVLSPGNKEGSSSLKQSGYTVSAGILSIRVFDTEEGHATVSYFLEAKPRENVINGVEGSRSTNMIEETELLCKRESQKIWSDRIPGKVTVLAGNFLFWAVGCEDGRLQIYTKSGRRSMPVMILGSACVFIDCDETGKLMLVTRNGSLYVWDIINKKCVLRDSLVSLITTDPSNNRGAIKVKSAKFSESGSPLVVLDSHNAYLFDMNLMCWLRVVDDSFPASNFASSGSGSSHGGELIALQVEARKFQARKLGLDRMSDDEAQSWQTRAHLEIQMASALSLESPDEYRQYLLAYVRFLTREADEPRLREVCESFLGPPAGMNQAESPCLETPSWDSFVLGMNKRKLLGEDILPAMATNRAVQRLLNEFISLVAEYGTTGAVQPTHDQT